MAPRKLNLQLCRRSTHTTGTSMTSTHDLIAATTSTGAVSLLVGHLDGMITSYRDVIALAVLDTAALDTAAPAEQPGACRIDASAVLGRYGIPIVVLRHALDLPPAGRGRPGLFRTAILFEDRAGLASVVATAPPWRSRTCGAT